MDPKIEIIAAKKLIGMVSEMSVTLNTTADLYRKFMPRRKELLFLASDAVYDLREYPPGYFLKFNPDTSFKKWALMEVSVDDNIPPGMQSFILRGGKYAVFEKDPKDTSMAIFVNIFTKWLPNSDYELEDRPHFEKFEGIRSSRNSYDSELIYIPVIEKGQ